MVVITHARGGGGLDQNGSRGGRGEDSGYTVLVELMGFTDRLAEY